jgi:Icc protein
MIRLLHITDPHLFGSETDTLRGVATLPGLRRVLAQALGERRRIDAILLTGDLVQDDPAGYAHVRRELAPLGLPVLCIPGNHDDPAAMRRALHGEPFRLGVAHDFGRWRVVQLDTCVPGEVGGRLSAAALAEFDAALAGAAGRPALVCLHHHPVGMSSRWMDEIGLANADEFFGVVDAHPNVRAVLWGHVHQEFEGARGGVRLLASPSTCSQFLPRADEFAIDTRPPGYRWLELEDDGTLRTEVAWAD